MTNNLEKLISTQKGIFNSKNKKVDAIPIEGPIILHGTEILYGDNYVEEIKKGILALPFSSPEFLKRKPQGANAYIEFERWDSEWSADGNAPCIRIQYYKILRQR